MLVLRHKLTISQYSIGAYNCQYIRPLFCYYCTYEHTNFELVAELEMPLPNLRFFTFSSSEHRNLMKSIISMRKSVQI